MSGKSAGTSAGRLAAPHPATAARSSSSSSSSHRSRPNRRRTAAARAARAQAVGAAQSSSSSSSNSSRVGRRRSSSRHRGRAGSSRRSSSSSSRRRRRRRGRGSGRRRRCHGGRRAARRRGWAMEVRNARAFGQVVSNASVPCLCVFQRSVFRHSERFRDEAMARRQLASSLPPTSLPPHDSPWRALLAPRVVRAGGGYGEDWYGEDEDWYGGDEGDDEEVSALALANTNQSTI